MRNQRDSCKIHDAQGIDARIFNIRLNQQISLSKAQGQTGGVIDDLLLRLLVQGKSLTLIQCLISLLNQSIHLRTGISAVVKN